MSGETLSDLDLLRDAARETREHEAKKKGGRFVQYAFPGGPARSLVRFGAKPSGLHDDKLSTKPAPGPRGGNAADDVEWAKQRRRERAEEERSRR